MNSWEDDNSGQLELIGLTLPGSRKFETNAYTSYSFCEGFLRGLRVGGYTHCSKPPIGPGARAPHLAAVGEVRFVIVSPSARLSIELNFNPRQGEAPAIIAGGRGQAPALLRAHVSTGGAQGCGDCEKPG